MTTAILAIILFCVMIFPHELGHFIAARAVGVKVNEFAFGMGPAIWKKQGAETLYSIRLFPIGGFCAMEGENGDEDEGSDKGGSGAGGKDCAGNGSSYDAERSFAAKKPWQKIVVLAAGSFMNVLCAVLIMTLVLGIMGFTTNKIGEITPGSPAEAAGLSAGDEILSIDGNKVESWNDVITYMPQSDTEVAITVDGSAGQKTVQVQPVLMESEATNGEMVEHYAIGITSKISHNPVTALRGGVVSTWNLGKMIFESLGMLISGEAGADDLTGPVGMVQMVSETATYGFWYYGFLTAMICVNLAIINMLPLPALDGGRIIFVLLRLVIGESISDKVEGVVHFIGMTLLMGLMIYVCFNDVIRLGLGGA